MKLEEKILELVCQYSDGLCPSEIVLEGYSVGQIRSASLALAARGDVEVGDDWKMRVEYTYLGESRYGSVYKENGVAVAGKWKEPMMHCQYCQRWIAVCPDKTCDGCWEITSRFKDFIRYPEGRKYVKECLEKTK